MPIQPLRLLTPGLGLPAVLLPALLIIGSICQAEVLYKWHESDGTLTFSPEPPSDSSISYEKVESDQGLKTQPITATAPPANSGDLSAGLTRSPASAPATASAIQRPLTKPNPTRSRQKTAQCQELKKRVISLERLLTTDISNETMDNAVVQMARYQDSFNQACDRVSLR